MRHGHSASGRKWPGRRQRTDLIGDVQRERTNRAALDLDVDRGCRITFQRLVTATRSSRDDQTVAEFVDLPLRSDRGDPSDDHPLGATRPFGQWDRDLRVNGLAEAEDGNGQARGNRPGS